MQLQIGQISRGANFTLLLSAFVCAPIHARTITVTAPHLDIAPDGECSLSEAVTAVNTSSDVNECPAGELNAIDTIEFNLSNGQLNIEDTYFVPVVTSPVIIDGTSQPGTDCANGPHIYMHQNGLRLYGGSDGSVVRGFRLTGNYSCGNFGICTSGGALRIESASNIAIQCNAFGSDNNGNAHPLFHYTNLLDIRVREGASEITIGTNGDGINDAIEGNRFESRDGIYVSNSQNIHIAGNVFNELVRDYGGGATIWSLQHAVVGSDPASPSPEQSNVFLGQSGIWIGGPGLSDVGVFGNWMGMNPDGTDATGSGGIYLTTGDQIQIGYWDPTMGPDFLLSNRILDHANGISTQVNAFDVTANIEGNLFMRPPYGSGGISTTRGIQMRNDAANFTIRHNAFHDLDVALYANSGTIASGASGENCIEGNTLGAQQEGAGQILAGNNWWGSPDGPSGNGNGNGDPVTGTVSVAPFLRNPPTSCLLIPGRFQNVTAVPTLSRVAMLVFVIATMVLGMLAIRWLGRIRGRV